jgi:23S rRNA (adenine2503-C2)-methyltransferase
MNDIRNINFDQLVSFLKENGEKPFRAKQVWTWLWKRGASSFEEMTDLSVSLRQKLSDNYTFQHAEIVEEVSSRDKTTKYLLRFSDGKLVEGVLIPSKGRVTACLSTQVGCPLHCAFCATGTMGFIRNLHYSEVIDEFVLLNNRSQEIYNQRITNIVFMGMGEPLLNFDNMMTAIDILTGQDYFGLSPARITLSTAGIVKGIKALADRNFRCGLAISLHSADPMVRRAIMPVTERNSLHDLQAALVYYHEKTGERITIEYLLLSKVNDSEKAAEQLTRFCRPFPVKINIIEYNSTSDSLFYKSDPTRRQNFVAVLERCNMVVNIRQSKGQDIAAACGQLVRQTN